MTLKIEEIDAISNGDHGDLFGVLGLHTVNVDGKEKLVFRAFRPDAKELHLLLDGVKKPVEVSRVNDAGFFEHLFARRKKRFAYKIRVIPYEGEAYEIEDAYRFGPLISDFDLQLWGEGNHHHAYRLMGAHHKTVDGVEGTHFVVSAPSAGRVSVIGSFNGWDGRIHGMRKYHDQGIWETFIPHVAKGDLYKYEIKSHMTDAPLKKADPYAASSELRPGTASRVWVESYDWGDHNWMDNRKEHQHFNRPVSIYEIHAGSWKRKVGETPGFLSYRELAEDLVPYVSEMGFTHVELMPVAEHPYDPSWGYQITGYFAPTSRFGNPDDFRYFVDECHKAGIGVILDWVPAHFTKDDHGLRRFDGTAMYEHEDPRLGEHTDWGTCIFNYGRTEVMNFLISNAVYWAEEFHIDGLRVDAVASMLYLDYSRDEGEWIPNQYGGRENLEAIHFLRRFNEVIHEYFPGILTFAEESTSWQGVSRPTSSGGLGFDFKWNMGWMNDTLAYMEKDPIYRKYHQDQLSFSLIYAFSEQFILPLSHDEVVHMKQSLLSKMPGDDWQKFANLRLLYTYMYGHPGKKLLFMGDEIGQWSEWTEAHSIDWHLLEWESHQGIKNIVKDLNRLYVDEGACHEIDSSWEGFEWIDISDADNSLLSFVRRGRNPDDFLVFLLNFTPSVHKEYKFGVPEACEYRVILNSDSEFYGGSNAGPTKVQGKKGPWHSQPNHIVVDVPPLAGVVLKPV
ncbi:1,4-alpha-glucan branching protein GlgB [Rhodohalobacter mucosus]|uniref:1,4-alpha-glucan branching enzyme GlgB n=1 Tax=Rhodohalobacter mucosus TaxID=2079485 RepID=A0A316TRA1_9BACT|nr:1,4-alpha-glucan branching protein GlgB [Rhodohalobacter mucosus]PWN05555.1 1,4-alpha-glucan branching enzyme [Rhodohalobacter mucosus]